MICCVDRRPERVDRGAAVDLGDPREQLPVEAPPEQRGRADDPARGRVEPRRAAAGSTRATSTGTDGVERRRSCVQPPSSPASAPAATSPASSSSTRNGLPSLCRCDERRRRSAGSVSVSRQAATIRSTSLGGEGVEPRIVAPARADRSRASGVGGTHPRVGRCRGTATGSSARASARYSTHRQRLRVGPVQVLEHEQRRRGPTPATVSEAHDGLAEQDRRLVGCRPAPRRATAGTSLPRCPPNPDRSGSSGGGGPREVVRRSASVSGRYGTGLSPGHAPARRGPPSPAARPLPDLPSEPRLADARPRRRRTTTLPATSNGRVHRRAAAPRAPWTARRAPGTASCAAVVTPGARPCRMAPAAKRS